MTLTRHALALTILFAATAGTFAIGCGGSPPPREELPAVKPADVVVVAKFDPTSTLDTRSEEVSFKVADHDVPGTLIQPVAPGKYPGIVLMAGSGPTDRDWTSPLIPGANGSGKLLAQLWAAHGAVVLRFDKAAIGENKYAHDSVTLDTYVDELRGALNTLRGRDAVDVDHLFLVGNSEGGMHVIRAALGEGGRLRGLILISSMGRTGRDISLSQNQALFDEAIKKGEITADAARKRMDAIKAGMDAFIEGRAIDPALLEVEPNLAAFAHMPDAKLVRDLWSFDPAEGAARLHIPILVVNGLKDIQVDPQLDAVRLDEKIRGAGGDSKLFLAPDANHVLKHETRSMAELRSLGVKVVEGYNVPGTKLDDTAISAINAWLVDHTGK